MEKIKNNAIKLYQDKNRFAVTLFHVIVAFLFFLGLFMPFMKLDTLFNGLVRVSLAMYPGGVVFVLIILSSILGYAYLAIMENEKWMKRVLLLQLIFATIFHIYGALVYRYDAGVTTHGGFGRIWTFLFLVLMYVKYIKMSLFTTIINRYVPMSDSFNTEIEYIGEEYEQIPTPQTYDNNTVLSLGIELAERGGKISELPEEVEEDTITIIRTVLFQAVEYQRQMKENNMTGTGFLKSFLKKEYSWINKENMKALLQLADNKANGK